MDSKAFLDKYKSSGTGILLELFRARNESLWMKKEVTDKVLDQGTKNVLAIPLGFGQQLDEPPTIREFLDSFDALAKTQSEGVPPKAEIDSVARVLAQLSLTQALQQEGVYGQEEEGIEKTVILAQLTSASQTLVEAARKMVLKKPNESVAEIFKQAIIDEIPAGRMPQQLGMEFAEAGLTHLLTKLKGGRLPPVEPPRDKGNAYQRRQQRREPPTTS